MMRPLFFFFSALAVFFLRVPCASVVRSPSLGSQANPLAPARPAAYTCTFMADYQHKPTAPEAVPPAEVARNARYGLVLFALYSALYGAFVLLNAFAPDVMETIVFAGVNLAVLYGLGLIATAFVL